VTISNFFCVLLFTSRCHILCSNTWSNDAVGLVSWIWPWRPFRWLREQTV